MINLNSLGPTAIWRQNNDDSAAAQRAHGKHLPAAHDVTSRHVMHTAADMIYESLAAWWTHGTWTHTAAETTQPNEPISVH